MPTITEERDTETLATRRPLRTADEYAEMLMEGARRDRIDQAGALIFFLLFAASALTTTFVLVKLFELVVT